MRRFIVIGLIATLAAGALAPEGIAAKKKRKKKIAKKITRTETAPYSLPSGVMVMGSGGAGPAATLATKTKEKWISLVIEDQTGLPVGGSIAQNTDQGQFADDNQASFCGTLDAVRITGGFPVYVYVTAGTCGGEAAASAPTTGAITAKISNRK